MLWHVAVTSFCQSRSTLIACWLFLITSFLSELNPRFTFADRIRIGLIRIKPFYNRDDFFSPSKGKSRKQPLERSSSKGKSDKQCPNSKVLRCGEFKLHPQRPEHRPPFSVRVSP